ncbi:MAG: thiamine-phosphate kinase [Xanthomonadaceae bacterium]|nr:thiamine-phosphate kinase [Xanthomonadaceae bacterium]
MLSEREIIKLITGKTGAPRDDVALGIGDDAAVLQPRSGHELVVCADTLVAGVHFPDGTAPSAIGHKALAVNLSDLAAMGAEPGWALLALTLPEADEAWLREFATGFSELATRFEVMLVGGDTTRGPLTVSVTALGQVPAGGALRRAGARPGDALCVSGTLGDAALALAQWRAGGVRDVELAARLDLPEPRVALGLALRGIAHAAIDVSDGLLSDLRKLIEADGLGATVEIEQLPRSERFAASGGTTEMMLGGGDDYELLFALPAAALPGLAAHSVTRIGTVEAERGVRCVDGTGRPVKVTAAGYEHFG